jgi:hypothetical protein
MDGKRLILNGLGLIEAGVQGARREFPPPRTRTFFTFGVVLAYRKKVAPSAFLAAQKAEDSPSQNGNAVIKLIHRLILWGG